MYGVVYKIKIALLVLLAILILLCIGLLLFSGNKTKAYENGVYVYNESYVGGDYYAKAL